MNELTIELEEVNPKYFFGTQEANVDLLRRYFPKLKIVARGNKLMAYGDEALLDEFDQRMAELLEYFLKYNILEAEAVENILINAGQPTFDESLGNDVLVHGVGGRAIKAQTANQRKLVDLMDNNDMVFAIGPAGTGKTYTCVALAEQLDFGQGLALVIEDLALEGSGRVGAQEGAGPLQSKRHHYSADTNLLSRTPIFD